MALEAEQNQEQMSVSERMETVRPDELGEETLSFGERLIIAQQIESMRKDIRSGHNLINERMGRMDSRLSDLIAGNAAAIAENAAAISANTAGIEGLKALIRVNAEGIADNRRAIEATAVAISANTAGIEGLKALIRVNAEGIADNRRAIEANATAIAGLSEKLTEVRVGIKDDVIAANKEDRDRADIRKGWWLLLLAALIGSGTTVGLTILAARLGLMAF